MNRPWLQFTALQCHNTLYIILTPQLCLFSLQGVCHCHRSTGRLCDVWRNADCLVISNRWRSFFLDVGPVVVAYISTAIQDALAVSAVEENKQYREDLPIEFFSQLFLMESTLTALDERDTKLSLSAAKYICKLLWPLGGPAHPFFGRLQFIGFVHWTWHEYFERATGTTTFRNLLTLGV